MATEPALGDIKLNGEHYRVDMMSYHERDITDFAPRATVAGGSVVASELGLYQVFHMTDWRAGLGFLWDTMAENGYMRTDGSVDTRHEGLVMLMTTTTQSDTANQPKEGFDVFNSDFYSYGDGGGGVSGIRVYRGGAWSDQQDDTPADYADVNYILGTKTYLFICPDGARIQKIATYTDAIDAKADFDSTVENGSSAIADENDRLKITIDGSQNTVYGKTTGPVNDTDFIAEFYLESTTDDLTMAADDEFVLLKLDDGSAVGGVTDFYYLFLGYDGTDYYLKQRYYDDSGVANNGTKHTFKQNEIKVRAEIQASSGAGEDDGYCKLWMGGILEETLSSTDNDQKNIDDVYIAAIAGIDSGTSGDFFLEDIRYTYGSGSHISDAGVNASSSDYKWLVVHGGYIYAGKDDSALVFRDNNEDLSSLAGDTADDPDYILVGGGRYPTIGAISYLRRLIVSSHDGLYEIGDDLTARKVIDASGEVSSSNFRSMGVYKNFLIYAMRHKIYRWNGSNVVDISPNPLTDAFPYTTYGRFDNITTAGDFLYCTARTNETTYEEHLLCYDGVGWHKLADLVTNGTDAVTGIGYDAVNNYLWAHVQEASTNKTYYIELQDESEFPYANFPTSGTHSWISSRIALGFQRVTKSTPSIVVEGDNLTADRYLQVYYKMDGGSWNEWGGTGKGKVISDGVTELFNPTGKVDDTIEYEYIQIRVDFISDSSAQSPVMEGLTLRFIMRPDDAYGYRMHIPIGNRLKTGSGTEMIRKGYEQVADLKAVRSSKKPVSYTDPYGDEHKAYMTALEIRPTGGRKSESTPGGYPDIDRIAMVNLVEL